MAERKLGSAQCDSAVYAPLMAAGARATTDAPAAAGLNELQLTRTGRAYPSRRLRRRAQALEAEPTRQQARERGDPCTLHSAATLTYYIRATRCLAAVHVGWCS